MKTTSNHKIAKVIKLVSEKMARINYKSASTWSFHQPKEPKMPENMK